MIEQFSGDLFKYYSFDETLDTIESYFQEDLLNNLTLKGFSHHELILKRPFILFHNINHSEDLCNKT